MAEWTLGLIGDTACLGRSLKASGCSPSDFRFVGLCSDASFGRNAAIGGIFSMFDIGGSKLSEWYCMYVGYSTGTVMEEA